ncbi:MAG TPA: DUF4340 domain-containing protein [Turneriella sp.]|nr:DUF4340 domain-containing protein [Turneriella sp.]
MERQKKNLILAATLGVIFILGFLINDPFLIFETSYEKSKPVIASRLERVKKITVLDGTSKRTFTRTTDGWALDNAAGTGVLRADSEKIESGLKNLFEARRYQEVSSNKEKQGEYEVRDNDFQIQLDGERSEKIAHAYLGKYSPSGSSSFIRLAGENAVYAVKGFLKGDWNQDIDQYRDHSILKIAKENIKRIEVSGKNSFALKASDTGELVLDPPRATDKARVSTYASEISEFNGQKFFREPKLPPSYGKIKITLSAGITKEIEFFGPIANQEFVVKSTDMNEPLTTAKSKVDNLFPRLEDLVDKAGAPQLVVPPQK